MILRSKSLISQQRRIFLDQRVTQSMLALDLVTAPRREIPGLGTKKLYLLLREPLQKSGITMGRDQLHELLRVHYLLIRHRRSVPKTTHSHHLLRKYPNLIKGLPMIETEQVWVCNMTQALPLALQIVGRRMRIRLPKG